MSRPSSNKFVHSILILFGATAVALGMWLLFVVVPTLPVTGMGLVALLVGGFVIFHAIHKPSESLDSEGLNENLRSEQVAPHDPLAWMDEAKRKAEEAQAGGAVDAVNAEAQEHGTDTRSVDVEAAASTQSSASPGDASDHG